MATNYKVLGQALLGAGLYDVDVYTAPASTEAVISTIIIANRDSAADTFRLAVRPSGASLSNEHYLAYDVPIAENDSTTLTLGITLGAADVITASGTGALSISIFGSEIS